MARILIVDDDPSIRALVHATLDYGAHELVEANDGTSALAQLDAVDPDLVILDLDLPGALGGVDVLQRRARDTRARFIVLTGSGRSREAQVRAAGAAVYLTKPFSPLELLARIDEALGGPRAG